MTKQFFSSIIALFLFTLGNAQTITPLPITIPFAGCETDAVHEELMNSDSLYKQQTEAFERYMEVAKTLALDRTANIYKVPVVVHVIHTGDAIGTGTNLSDEQVKQGIDYINQRFRKIPNGLGDGGGVDVGIEFALAVRDENNNCTNGIVRVDLSGNAAYSSEGVNRYESGGISEADLKSVSRWDPTKYYNIYIIYKIDDKNCTDNGGDSYVAGYAYYSSSHGSSLDGTVILACSYLNENSVTFTHELGHAFNLKHTFEGDNGGTSCPTGNGDYCDDTPKHKRYSSHPEFLNEYNECSYAGTNSCDAGTTQDHMHNYMDYSWDVCQTEFTADQKTRAVAAMTTDRSSFLESNGNISLLPVNKATVDFNVSAKAICTGSTVTFTDESTCSPNSYINTDWPTITYLWEFDNGVTPKITSTEQNPAITFNDNGSYTVTLQITNSHGTSSKTSVDYVVVANAPTAACTPTSGNEGNYGYTVNNVTFGGIDYSSNASINVGHLDLSCTNTTILHQGISYPLSVTFKAGTSYKEVLRVYIDWNDNGIFESTELLLSDETPKKTSKTATTTVDIPADATFNKTLRMRVYGEANALTDTEVGCGGTLYVADVEDYGVYLVPLRAPVANFNANSSTICLGDTVTFADLSDFNPTSWNWSFIGGSPSSSTDQNPKVVYNSTGSYAVALTASNGGGNNTETKSAYINVIESTGSLGTITGANSVCDGDVGVTYSVDIVNNITNYNWTVPTDAIITSGQGTATITVTYSSTSGNITATPSNSCGTGGSASLEVNVAACGNTATNIEDASMENIRIYPNPTNSMLFIDTQSSSLTGLNKIVLTDTYGKTIFELKNFQKQVITIDLTNQIEGLYFLQLQGSEETIISKIIKQ